jgi:hypothetical protein
MITHTLFDSHANDYSYEEATRRSVLIAQAIRDGYKVKWNDHQAWSWATIEFETDAEAVEFKLRYI